MRIPKGRHYLNRSVSFPPELLEAAQMRAESLRLSFSAYVQRCIEMELERLEPIVLRQRENLTRKVAEAIRKPHGRGPA